MQQNLLDFKIDGGRMLATYNNIFIVLETNVQEVTDILKQKEENKEFELIA